MPKESPPVAHFDEYDSDASVTLPGTRVHARSRTTASQPPSSNCPVVVERVSERIIRRETIKEPSAASRPYSQAQNTVVVNKAKSKPVIHRADSHQDSSTKASAPRAPSVPRRNPHCPDPKCNDPNCASVRNPERRYTIAQTPQYSVPYSTAPPPQIPAQQHRYSYTQSNATPILEVPAAIPRARRQSLLTARPVSFHGYPASQYGPPPAPSAYYHPNLAPYYTQPQQYPQAPTGYPGRPPISVPSYKSASPLNVSPTSPMYPPVMPGLPRTYSARQVRPDNVPYVTSQPLLARTISARQVQPSARQIPGSYPEESSESESETDSEDERREREYQRARAERQLSGRPVSRRRSSHARDRDRELMPPPPSRRPSLTPRYISSPAVTSSTRETLRRAPRSDSDLDYPSDYGDSDRTARAVVHPRTDSSYSGRSRRPSLSSHASSGRTKATTISSGSGSGSRGYVLEDRHGRQTSYLSKNAQAELIQRMERQKLADRQYQERMELQEKVEAYQREVRGGQPVELTAENINKAQRRTSGSHSHVTTRTRRSESHASSKSKGTNGDGIKIQSGDTVLHVYGEAKIEMRPGEDGGPAQFIIGSQSPNGKEKSYYGSKSTSSRVGRVAESEKVSKS